MKFIQLIIPILLFISCNQTKVHKTKNKKQEILKKEIIKTGNNDTVMEYGINFHPKISDYYVTDSSDCQVIDKKCFVLIYPTEKQIEKLKKLNETDFYVVADDNNYYMSELIEKSKKMGINTITAKKRKLCFISNEGKNIVDLDKKEKGELMDWNLIIFNPKKLPEFTSFIEPNDEYLNKYFNK